MSELGEHLQREKHATASTRVFFLLWALVCCECRAPCVFAVGAKVRLSFYCECVGRIVFFLVAGACFSLLSVCVCGEPKLQRDLSFRS